jgi:alpha-amylase
MAGGLTLPRMMLARRLWAYGTQREYFTEDKDCVGFTREGHPSQSAGAGMAVVMTTAWEYRFQRMCVGRRHAGERWTDVVKFCYGEVVIDEHGFGLFPCSPRMVSVWVNREAESRDAVDALTL